MLNIELYNKGTNKSGYLNSSGILVNNDIWSNFWVTTDFMQVTPGSSCTYSGITFSYKNMYACYYNIDYEFISSFIPETVTTQITVPKDAYFIRFSLCRQTKLNLCSSPFEIGSINEVSGSTEAGNDFIRTVDYIVKDNYMTKNSTYTVSINKPMYQAGIFYYRSTSDNTPIYNSYVETELNRELTSCTFTTPNINLYGIKIKFYNRDGYSLDDLEIMLNNGEEHIEYIDYSDSDVDNSVTFSFTILAEAYQSFRDELYQWLKTTLSPNLTEGDLDIIIRLMCYIFGDLSGQVYLLKDQIDPDRAGEIYLKHLGNIIGYEWNNALTAEQQRESMKLYIDIQKRRGTQFSLKNLIAVFGQDKQSYYSNSDLRGIQITEGGKNGEPVGTIDDNGLYPGDIMIELSNMDNILVNAIDNIRLIGTRIFFTYALSATINVGAISDDFKEVHQFFMPVYHYGNDYNPTINEWIKQIEDEYGEDYTLADIEDWPILQNRVDNCRANCSCVIYTAYKEPFDEGFIFNIAGKTNYHGYLLSDEVLVDDENLYGYKNQPKK